MKYLLDTDICIYIIKRKPTSVFDRIKELVHGEVGISSITYSELCFGVYKSQHVEKNMSALSAFVTPLEILPYDDTICTSYGEIRSELEKGGTPIGPLDTLIAAHARSVGAILVTNNAKEFPRVSGLLTEVWT